jgi:hypothetical protein
MSQDKVVPEKLATRSNIRAAISSQFWGGAQHSPRYLDGRVWALPCEPPPLDLAAPSGLSRAQQLLASQALGLPAMPAYDAAGGGLVLDRVLARVGGRRWWATLGGRAKAGRVARALGAGGAKAAALRDLESYSLNARARVRAGRFTLDAAAEAPDAAALRARAAAGAPPPPPDWLAARLALRAALPGHDLTAVLARELDAVSADGEAPPARVPLAASLDLSSHDRADGLQYRVGLHQAVAPPTEGSPPGPGAAAGGRRPLRAVLHAQGAVAVEGQAYVWRRGGRPVARAPDAPPASPAAAAAAAAADAREAEAEAGVGYASSADEAAGGAPARLEDFSRPLEGSSGADSTLALVPATRLSVGDGGSSSSSATAADAPALPPPERLLPVSAESVAGAIAGSLAALTRLRADVGGATADVQEGSLQRLSEQLSRRAPPRRRPYSPFLATPHLKLSAAIGCLARMPLPTAPRLFPPRAADSGPPSAAGSSARAHRRSASQGSLASRASRASALADAWEPYLKGTALRIFASAGVSGQLGRFTRPLFDYTSAALRLDLGLSSPHVLGAPPGGGAPLSAPAAPDAHRPDKHRAFALEGRGSWHALTVSLGQQVAGPLRARADLRFALDPAHVPAGPGERSTLKGLAQTALSVRPALLDAAYGLDLVLPGTGGAARLAAWYSPRRREAMAELRLF